MMTKTVVVYCLLLIAGLLSTVSCFQTCDGFDKYKLTGFSYFLKQIYYTDSTSGDFGKDVIDTVEAGKRLEIILEALVDNYDVSYNTPNTGLFSSALACKPDLPDTDERFKKLEILADVDFGGPYQKGKNLTDLFDFYYGQPLAARDFTYETFEMFYTQDDISSIPNGFGMILNIHPDDTTRVQFTVKYYQEGIDLDSIIIELRPVVLLPL